MLAGASTASASMAICSTPGLHRCSMTVSKCAAFVSLRAYLQTLHGSQPWVSSRSGDRNGTHGNWVAVNPQGRVIMAQALSANFGRDRLADQRLEQLCKDDQLRRAHCWGLAMRLGQRMSGGVASVLKRTRLEVAGGELLLLIREGEDALVGDVVERRFVRLAQSLGLDPVVTME